MYVGLESLTYQSLFSGRRSFTIPAGGLPVRGYSRPPLNWLFGDEPTLSDSPSQHGCLNCEDLSCTKCLTRSSHSGIIAVMSSTDTPTSSLHHLASRLEQDIRQRGLWAGDRYLTASEAAELLGVSTATAHRAMQVLAQRRMLVRHPSRGTFVGPHFEMKQNTMIRTVCALMPAPALDRDTPPWNRSSMASDRG